MTRVGLSHVPPTREYEPSTLRRVEDDSMEIRLMAVRSPEGLLRLVSTLHRHRWPVERLLVESGETPHVQHITLRIGIDLSQSRRVIGVLNSLVDVIDINLR